MIGHDEPSVADERKITRQGSLDSNASETEAWLIDKSDLEFTKIISENAGSTAVVYHAHFKDGRGVAVKQMYDMDDEIVVQRELSVLTTVQHKNIVQLYGIVNDQHPLQLCLEFCEGGSLFMLLHRSYKMPLSWRQRLAMLYDVAVAMDYLHGFDPKIVHRDLKSLNILLLHPLKTQDDQPHIKVCDFGLAREHVPGAVMTSGAGTLQWMAPEVFSSTDYTEAADIFSYAIVAFEIICRRIPYIKDVNNDQFHWAIRKGHRPDIHDPRHLPEVVPSGLIDLVERCWHQQPLERPPFSQILEDLAKVVKATPSEVKRFAPPTGVESI